MGVSYTKLYGYGEKADTSFEITNETFRLFQAFYCLVGVISFQTVNCIGRRPPILLHKQHGVQREGLPPQKFVSPLRFVLLYDKFKTFLALPSPLNIETTIRHHTQFPLTPSFPGKPHQAICLPPGQTNISSLPQHTNRHLLKCTFSKSLTYKQANLKQPYNQGMKVQH